MNIYVLAVFVLCLAASALLRRKRMRAGDSTPVLKYLNFDNLVEAVRGEINRSINSETGQTDDLDNESEKRRLQIIRLRQTTREACFGDRGDREYVKEYIKELLQKKLGINESSINEVISFDKPESMSAAELFEYLYMIYSRVSDSHVFSRMVEDFGFAEPKEDAQGSVRYSVSEEDIRTAYLICRYGGEYSDMLETLTQRCYEKLYGHDAADILIADPDIDGVSGGVGGRTRIEYDYLEELGNVRTVRDKNCYDTIYCVYRGKLLKMSFLSFGSESALIRVVKNIYRYNTAATLSKRNPVLNASMKNNSRVVVARPPVSDSWVFFVRKFASIDARSLESLITDRNSEQVIALLKDIIRAELNFTISGNTGGGKTTLVKALIKYINPAYALRVIESSFELNINNLYPDRNVEVMQERGNFTVYDAIAASKKMDTDVLILGEVNEPKIAGAFIQVAQSGSRMAITTLHHETTTKLIEYMRNALVSEFGISDVRIAEKQVVDSINFDIHMVHDVTGHHYIERITEITPQPKGYKLQDIVVFDRERSEYRFICEPAFRNRRIVK